MPKKIFPLNTRKAALRAYAEGVTPTMMTRRFGVAYHTVEGWAKNLKIGRNQPITEEEIAKRLKTLREDLNARVADDEEATGDTRLAEKQREKLRIRYGLTKEEEERRLATFRNLDDHDAIKGMIEFQLSVALSMLGSEMTVPGIVNTTQVALLLDQLRKMLDAPPVILSVKDMLDNFKMMREILQMDKKESGPSEGAELRWLVAKPIPGQMVEAERVEPKRKRPHRSREENKKSGL